MIKSQTEKLPIKNFAILIVAFLLIGMVFGPNAGQVYTGISATGSDTVELTNNGNLDTKVRDLSLSSVPVASATGGTITREGDYYVHTFTSSGVFTLPFACDVEYLVVAGGGGGGGANAAITSNGGGGGGAGSVRSGELSVIQQAYPITVGVGGAGSTTHDTKGFNGDDSIFSSVTAVGGGAAGASLLISDALNIGNDGGSGGAGNGGKVGGDADYLSPVQGYDGGDSLGNGGSIGGPGGGGAGAKGDSNVNAPNGDAGSGGVGILSSISGTSVYYAGGGGGGAGSGAISLKGYGGIVGSGDGGDNSDGQNGGVNTGSGGGDAWDSVYDGGDGGSGIVVIRYLVPTIDVINPGIAVGDDKLYYDGTLSSILTYSDGSAYIGISDVTASMKGSLPIIKVDTTQNIKVDHDLEYIITYLPKNMDVSSPNMFNAGEDLTVNTRLIDTNGNPTTYQPLEMRIRLFDSEDNRYLDEIVSSISFVVPGEYIKDGKHYQLRLSYEGYEFGGWSNEILADFNVGTEGFIITSSPDKAPEGLSAASFAAASNLVGMAAAGWLSIPIIGDIIQFIADLLGVTL